MTVKDFPAFAQAHIHRIIDQLREGRYASYDYQDMLESYEIKQSMSAKGNCYDNAAMESFFGRFKITSVGDITFADVDHARSAAFEYIEVFYNRFRKHSSLGYKSPVEFEAQTSRTEELAVTA
jgi:transposase InsO family protein